jgi:hypothetical protein
MREGIKTGHKLADAPHGGPQPGVIEKFLHGGQVYLLGLGACFEYEIRPLDDVQGLGLGPGRQLIQKGWRLSLEEAREKDCQ